MFSDKSGNRLSFFIAIFISVAILYCHFNLPKYKYNDYAKELTYDVASYYLYLPMTIIHHDPGMKSAKVDSLYEKYKFSSTLYQIHTTEAGTRVPNYTAGMCYFYLPYFLIGHIWALSSDYPADGFSLPYHIAISSGIFLFILPGIFFLRRLLIQFFADKVVSISLIVLFFGTNYFSEAVGNYLQPHVCLFTLYALLLYHTKKWHDNPSYKSAAIIGFCVGWLTLARPTDIISIMIPTLWGIYNKNTLLLKLRLIKEKFRHVLLLAAMGIVPFIPQFIYWKITTGSFIYFSYKGTEGFDFLAPHIWNVLFSFKKSLFIYTPLLVLPLVGLFFLPRRLPGQKYFIILFTLINFYLLSSWAVWWNGASLGMRYFVQSYCVLSIPFCISIERILRLKFWKYVIFIPVGFFIFLNLFQTWQFVNWILPEDRMNFRFYKATFLKTSVTEEDRKLMETFRDPGYTESFVNENEYNHYTLGYYNFEDLNATIIDTSFLSNKFSTSAPNSCRLSPEVMYYPTYHIRYDQLIRPPQDHVWLRVSLNFYSPEDMKDNPASLVINLTHNKYKLKYRAFGLENFETQKGKWNSMKVDYMTPVPYSEKDFFEIYVWYRGKSEIFIDDLKIEAYEKKNP